MRLVKKRVTIIILVLIVIASTGYFLRQIVLFPKTDEPGRGGAFSNPPESDKETVESVLYKTIADPATTTQDLVDVIGGKSVGIAYLLRSDGNLYHVVSAGLPQLETGDFYEGWLVKDDKSTFFSTGKMYFKANRWILEFKANNEYTDYNLVVITLEKKDDGVPEKHILESAIVQ